MSRKIVVTLANLLLASSLARADVRGMAAGDPNLAADWNFKIESFHTLYSSAVGESPASEHSARLPFFASGNALNASPHDYEYEDGWILVHRDFGIHEHGQPFPFFTMYNHYRGTFRVMVYNAMARDEAYYVGKLRFVDNRVDPWQPISLLNFTSTTKCFITDFDVNIEISATSYMKACGDWAVFDFPLVGYDPSLKHSDPILCFSLYGVDSQKLELGGSGSIDLVQQIQKKAVRPGFGISDVKQATDLGLIINEHQ